MPNKEYWNEMLILGLDYDDDWTDAQTSRDDVVEVGFSGGDLSDIETQIDGSSGEERLPDNPSNDNEDDFADDYPIGVKYHIYFTRLTLTFSDQTLIRESIPLSTRCFPPQAYKPQRHQRHYSEQS